MKRKRRLIREGKRILYSLGIILGMLLVLKVMNYSTHGHDEGEEGDIPYRTYFKEHYRIFSLELPDSMELGGEPVPLKELDVREKLDRELHVNTYWQSHSILLHKRAHRWFPVIEPILEEEGVPEDLKYIPLVESGFKNVVSPAGAHGFWQFMEGTAKDYGLEVNEEVDERYHVEKATRAACEYLKDAKEKYGSWALAVAAYNMGMNALDKRIVQQKVNNYYELLLNTETSRYIYRLLALKEIHRDPERYGFHIREQDLYQPYETREVVVDSSIEDLAAFAIDQDINYKALKMLNPWLRENELSNHKGKEYRIKLPKGPSEELILEDTGEFRNDTLKKRIRQDSISIEEEG